MTRLSGKVAFITGAGSGIGRHASILFAQNGAKVAIADKDREGARRTLERVREAGGEAIVVEVDVTDPQSVSAAIDQSIRRFGALNILYNNAGGSTMMDGPVTEAPLEEFWRAIKLDLFGTWLVCHYGVPELIKAGGGSVVNSSSVVALIGRPGRDAYTAAKGGVTALTRSMAVEYAPQGVRVNAVAPCATRTSRVMAMLKDGSATTAHMERLRLGLAEPEDVARAALYLASDESARTTGHILTVDSGQTMS